MSGIPVVIHLTAAALDRWEKEAAARGTEARKLIESMANAPQRPSIEHVKGPVASAGKRAQNITPADMRKVHRLLRAGLSVPTIAKQFGLSSSTLYHRLQAERSASVVPNLVDPRPSDAENPG